MTLPVRWTPGLLRSAVAEFDVRPTRHGRLFAKVVVFKSNKAMRAFWSHRISKSPLGRWTVGACNGLICWSEKRGQRRVTETDRRYFCVIGLIVGRVGMEVIAHEAVHAGFCYAKRVRRTPWAAARDFDEEEVAYPAGAIARAINRELHRRNLYDRKM